MHLLAVAADVAADADQNALVDDALGDLVAVGEADLIRLGGEAGDELVAVRHEPLRVEVFELGVAEE